MTIQALSQYIEDLLLTVKKDQHIFSIRWEGETFWVKRPQAVQPKIWQYLQKILNRLLPIEIVKSTLATDASSSLKQEIAQLKNLKHHQIPAPRLKVFSDQWLCMSDAGPTLHGLLEKQKCEQKILLKAAEALAQLHNKGCYHGRAKLNDLTLMADGTIGFIDFEEAPLTVMSLHAAQNRDLYLFISSLCRWDPAIAKDALMLYLTRTKADTAPLKQLLYLTKPVKLLRPFIHKMSRDIRQAYFAQKIFEEFL